MKSFKIPMTIDEFHLAAFPFGWKDEYCDGLAYFTPRDHGVLMKMTVENRLVEKPFRTKSASDTTVEKIIELFYAAFFDSVEFCDLSASQIKKRAAQNVKNYFNGARGIPVPELSRVAVALNDETYLTGACLVSNYKYGYKNEIIFVRPEFQNQGIGTALAANLLNELDKIGETVLWSEYHICNAQSERWHKKFGFVEVTDIMTAKFRRNFYRHEVWRHEKPELDEKIDKLNVMLRESEAEVETLEAVEENDFGAAWLSWKYDF